MDPEVMADWHNPAPKSHWKHRVTEDDNPDDVVRVRFRLGDEVTDVGFWWKGGLYRKQRCWIKAKASDVLDLDTML